MSTKRLLIGGQGFRLYEDLFEEGCVYLELSPVHFEARPQFVRVRIPIEVWETIRHHGGPDLSLLETSEEDLNVMVEAAVDERILAFSQGDLSAHFDAGTYGSVEASREDQIAAGMSAYETEIRRLREVSSAIDSLKRLSVPRSNASGLPSLTMRADVGGFVPFESRDGAVSNEQIDRLRGQDPET